MGKHIQSIKRILKLLLVICIITPFIWNFWGKSFVDNIHEYYMIANYPSDLVPILPDAPRTYIEAFEPGADGLVYLVMFSTDFTVYEAMAFYEEVFSDYGDYKKRIDDLTGSIISYANDQYDIYIILSRGHGNSIHHVRISFYVKGSI